MDVEHTKRTFSYDEARALLPEVRRLTAQAVERVDALHARTALGHEGGGGGTEGAIEEAVGAWARAMLELGLEVKGLWLVDFDNGSGYYCWRWPEPALEYYHSYEDGFRGRIRIH